MKYNSPFMKILETIANMLIVSFFWVVTSLPVLTIIPSTSALYHTVTKVIFGGSGKGVTKDYFNAFKANFVDGLKLNVIYLIATFFVVVGINTGLQIYNINTWGLLYLILGFLIGLVYATSLIYVPVVISKFYIRVIDVIKLSVFFASQNIIVSALFVLLLGLMVVIVNVVPLSIVIIPALYIDLIRPSIEKRIMKFIEENHLEENLKEEKEEAQEEDSAISLTDLNNDLEAKRKKGK